MSRLSGSFRPGLGVLAVVLLLLMSGCSSWGRRSYKPPPSSAGSKLAEAAGRPVVVVGAFESRVRSKVGGRQLGSGMSDALANALLESGSFDVWIDPTLGKRVAKLINQSAERREQELAKIRATHGDVHIVVTGTVTDFMHSQNVSPEVRRKRLFGGDSNEAVVAFRMNIIDLRAGRVVVTDHVHGLAKAPDTSEKELYANVTFGSYLFWSTPLGKASEEALGEAVDVLERIVPQIPIDQIIRVAEQVGPREVRLDVVHEDRLEHGREYHLCIIDPVTGNHETILDPATKSPVMARVRKRSWSDPVATLRGRSPVDVDLRGAVLCDDPIMPPAEETVTRVDTP